jgi:hypothetical protein
MEITLTNTKYINEEFMSRLNSKKISGRGSKVVNTSDLEPYCTD